MTEPKKEEKSIPVSDGKIIHKGVTCDGCATNDIEGARYKCAVCANFDFCEKCEASTMHVHPFLKIRTLEQTPIKIIAVVRDQENNIEVNGFKLPPQAGFEQLINKGMSFLSSMGQSQQQQAQQQQRPQFDPRCAFFKNMMQNQFQGWASQCAKK